MRDMTNFLLVAFFNLYNTSSPTHVSTISVICKKNLFCFAFFSYFHFFLRLYFFNCIVPPKTDAERRLRRRYHSPYITSLSRCNCCTHQFSTAQNVQLSDSDPIVASHSFFFTPAFRGSGERAPRLTINGLDCDSRYITGAIKDYDNVELEFIFGLI